MTVYDNIPKDPVMLLSFINTQLRDNFPTFTDFCSSYQLDPDEISSRMKAINYEYNPTSNRFE